MDKKVFENKIKATKKLGGDPLFYQLLLDIAALHARKNHDYAKQGHPLSNLTACEQIGITPYKGVLVRLQDKWSRIVELASKEAAVKDETIEDTHLDAAVYNLLAIVVRRREQEKKANLKKIKTLVKEIDQTFTESKQQRRLRETKEKYPNIVIDKPHKNTV